MAPRKTATATPAPAAPAAVPMTTLSGFAVSVLAFIPIDKKDLRKQAEIPMLLLDIQEGKKTIADLAPHLKNLEFRQQHINKRFTAEEAAQLMGTAPASLDLDGDKDQTHTPENTDIDSDGNLEGEQDGGVDYADEGDNSED